MKRHKAVALAAGLAIASLTVIGCSYVNIADSTVTLGDGASMVEKESQPPLIGLEHHAAPQEPSEGG